MIKRFGKVVNGRPFSDGGRVKENSYCEVRKYRSCLVCAWKGMMKFMKKIKISAILLATMMAVLLTGCNKEGTEVSGEELTEAGMTREQQQMYAEYAAGVLMKYNAGTNMRVLEGRQLVRAEEEENAKKEQQAKREQAAAEYEQGNQPESSSTDGDADGSETAETVAYVEDMGNLLGMEPFSIVYMGYEVTESYPSEASEEMFMAMDATAGNTLLVAKFAVTNTGSDTQTFDMLAKQGKFRVNVNGETIGAQYTLLLDDLSMYKEDIEAGATVDTVLIFEIPQEHAETLDSIEMTIKAGDVSGTMLL